MVSLLEVSPFLICSGKPGPVTAKPMTPSPKTHPPAAIDFRPMLG